MSPILNNIFSHTRTLIFHTNNYKVDCLPSNSFPTHLITHLIEYGSEYLFASALLEGERRPVQCHKRASLAALRGLRTLRVQSRPVGAWGYQRSNTVEFAY